MKRPPAQRRPRAAWPDIERRSPFGRLDRRRVYTLSVEDLQPVVRIAHRLRGPLNIPERIIFDHEIVLVTAGSGQFVPAQAPAEPLSAGDLLFIPPFQPHSISGDAAFEHVAVHFDLAPNLPPWARDPSRRKPYEIRMTGGAAFAPRARCPAGSEARQAVEALLSAWAEFSPISHLAVRVYLLRVLLALIEQAQRRRGGLVSGRRRNETRIGRSMRYMEEHFGEPIDAAALAAVVGLSTSQLTRLFHEHTGQTPMAYLRRLRVQRARGLLGNVDLSIKEIALRCGFDDPYHFSKVFHRLDGLPPSLYREALLAGLKR